jgi:hypothetical protein
MPIILAWEAEIWRTAVQGHPEQIVDKTPSPKKSQQNGLEAWLHTIEYLLCKHKALS